jgi:hypothetical protein
MYITMKTPPLVTDLAVNDELSRILEDPLFRAAKQASMFLSYAVSEELAGRGEDLSEDSFGKYAFPTQNLEELKGSGSIRRLAGRVREKLARYYATNGKDDSILIDLPARSYRPRFQWKRSADLGFGRAELFSEDEFKLIEAQLPKSWCVWVAGPNLANVYGAFREVVAKNAIRGVCYVYVFPRNGPGDRLRDLDDCFVGRMQQLAKQPLSGSRFTELAGDVIPYHCVAFTDPSGRLSGVYQQLHVGGWIKLPSIEAGRVFKWLDSVVPAKARPRLEAER